MSNGDRGTEADRELQQAREALPETLFGLLPQRGLSSVRPDAVRLGPGGLEWRATNVCWLPGAPATDCLFNFLELADAEDPGVFLDYAKRHGVLGLTEYGRPGHAARLLPPRLLDEPEWVSESLESWRAYARIAKMLLVLAMAMRSGHAIDPVAELQKVGMSTGQLTAGMHPYWQVPVHLHLLFASSHDASQQRSLLAEALQESWLRNADLWPRIAWSEGPAQLTLSLGRNVQVGNPRRTDSTIWAENHLFGVIAIELAGIVCSNRHVAQCKRCGRLYPAKRVQTHQTNYCPPCRPHVRRETNRKSAKLRYQDAKAQRQQVLTAK